MGRFWMFSSVSCVLMWLLALLLTHFFPLIPMPSPVFFFFLTHQTSYLGVKKKPETKTEQNKTEQKPEEQCVQCKWLKSRWYLFLLKHPSFSVSLAGESNICYWPIWICWAQCPFQFNTMYLTLCGDRRLVSCLCQDWIVWGFGCVSGFDIHLHQGMFGK